MTDPLAVREIKSFHRRVESLTEAVPTEDQQLREWLQQKAEQLKSNGGANKSNSHNQEPQVEVYMLSFHDDGVLWGKLKAEDGGYKLLTSDAIPHTPSPQFRAKTLQECRLFCECGELLVWQVDSKKRCARLILDREPGANEQQRHSDVYDAFNEPQVLWGTKTESGSGDFTIVADGSEGLRHAFPMNKDVLDAAFTVVPTFEARRSRPLRLHVRHYLNYDDDGCAYIALSRLVRLETDAP